MQTGVRERVGETLGAVWAPALAAIARAREARVFHPEGLVFSGRVDVRPGPYARVAERLGPHVLARLSPALWRGGAEHLDVLGIALRFHAAAAPTELPVPGDQDLLFATIRSPLTMALSPLFTNAHDFLANKYWAVAPFELDRIEHRVELRLVPQQPPDGHGTRTERLLAAVRAGRVVFSLQARRTLRWKQHTIAKITIEEPLAMDQATLRFDPFAVGAGFRPVGLVHAIRHAAYAASRRGRAIAGG
jgi:hypothetical protein